METPPTVTLSDRRAGVLRLVVREYVATAAPVGSKAIHDKYELPASPATIRHEMQALEEDGLLTHPHTSAGRVPSDSGYRLFVQSLMGHVDLSADEKATIRHQFFQASPELDEWLELAAVMLARSLGLLAVVSQPRVPEVRVRRLELIALKDLMALLVVVLHEAQVLKQLVTLDTTIGQEELSDLAERLNRRYAGRSWGELQALPEPQDDDARVVVEALHRVLGDQSHRDATTRVEGISGVLVQPEFHDRHAQVLEIMSLVEQHSTEAVVPPGVLRHDTVTVMIGRENQAEALRDCSIVVAPYGVGADVSGYLAVIGPTRMQYDRSVASVRYVSGLLQDLVEQVYG